MQPLFFEPTQEFQKLAAEKALPEDPNEWTEAILQEIHKQVPYLSDFDVEVVLETVDGERGYGLGHAQVTSQTEAPMTSDPQKQRAAGIRTSRIPVIVKDGMLLPLDVILNERAEALPLTETRLRQAMFRPQMFDVTSKTPGDQSMLSQLYPPTRQTRGFGGGHTGSLSGMGGKTASALDHYILGTKETAVEPSPLSKEASDRLEGLLAGAGSSPAELLGSALAYANTSDLDDFKQSLLDVNVKHAYARNPATYGALEQISAAQPPSLEKAASALSQRLRPTAVQVTREGGSYAVKTASHLCWDPAVRQGVSRGELVREFGEKIALDVDIQGGVTSAEEADGAEDMDVGPSGAEPISESGTYVVESQEGEPYKGTVLSNLLDMDGTPLPVHLFFDGVRATVQGDIAGTPAGEFVPPPASPASAARGYGVFMWDGPGGAPVATIPFKFTGRTQDPGEDRLPNLVGETFDGRPARVSVQPHIRDLVPMENGSLLVPDTWQWVSLDGADDVSLVESAEDVGKTAALKNFEQVVAIRGAGFDSFSVDGPPVEKIAREERQYLSQADALFLLAAVGVPPELGLRKLAEASSGHAPRHIKVPRTVKLASERERESMELAARMLSSQPVLRQRLWKEASVIPDPMAVDAVLSLGFINPENIATFVGYLPVLDEAQRRLCELLLASRLGIQEVPAGALERAVRSMEAVIEGLRVVAFQ